MNSFATFGETVLNIGNENKSVFATVTAVTGTSSVHDLDTLFSRAALSYHCCLTNSSLGPIPFE